MANKRIAGLIVEIGGDTTKLGRALSDVDARSKDLSKELGEVNRLLKLDPGNTELIAQKQKILAEQIGNTKERLDILREAQDQVTAAFERGEASEEELRAIQREVIATEQKLGGYEKAARETADAEKEVGDKAEESAADLEKQKEAAEDAKKKLVELAEKGAEKAKDTILALGAAVTGAVAGISKLVFDAADAADELGDLSTKTGLSVEQLQRYQYTADMCGTSLEVVTGAQSKLIKSMASAKDGTGATADKFKELGVNVTDANGELRNADDVFLDVIDSLGEIENDAERDAAAMDIFGKSAQELNGYIKEGSENLRAYGKEAEDLGAIVSEDTIGILGDVQTELKKVRAQFEATKENVAAKFAPVIQKALTSIQKLLKKGGELLQDPRIKRAIDKLVDAFDSFIDKVLDKALDLLPKVIDVVAFLVENFDKLAGAIGAVFLVCKGASVISGFVGAIKSITTAIGAATTASLGWVAVIGAVVAAMSALIVSGVKKAKEHFDEITASSQEVQGKLTDIADEMKNAAKEYDDAISKSTAAADMAEGYLDRLEELESQGRLTADEQREYNELVSKLQAVMPDLNIEIDKETGRLEDGATALKEQIKHWKEKVRQEAVENRLKKVYESQVGLQLAMNRAQGDYDKYHNENVYRWIEDNDKLRQGYKLTNEEMQWFADYGQQLGVDGIRGWQDLEKVMGATEDALNSAKIAYKENVDEAEELIDIYEEFEGQQRGGSIPTTEKATVAFEGLANAIGLTGEEAVAFAENHAQKVTGAVQDMFNEIDTSTDLSMEKIITTLKNNLNAFTEYEHNLQVIAERGASENVMKYLEGLGIEQAGVINMIANSTDEEFTAFIAQFETNTAAVYEAGKKWGKQAGAGIVSGMDAKEKDIRKSGVRAAKALAKAFTNVLEIKSPSRLFGRYAKFSAQGYINEFEDMTPKMADATADAAQAVADNFTPDLNYGSLERSLYGSSDAQQAAEAAKAGELMNMLTAIHGAIKAGQKLLLDGDVLVGGTADRMDAVLGRKAILAGRTAMA